MLASLPWSFVVYAVSSPAAEHVYNFLMSIVPIIVLLKFCLKVLLLFSYDAAITLFVDDLSIHLTAVD